MRKAGWSSVIESCRNEVSEAGKLMMASLAVTTEINHGHECSVWCSVEVLCLSKEGSLLNFFLFFLKFV